MAERDSLHAFPAKMAAAGIAVRLAAPKAVGAGAVVLTQVTKAQVRTAAPSLYLRNVGARGASVGVTFNVRGDTALVRATGPLHIIERDNKPHFITARRGRRLRFATRNGKSGYAMGTVKHPGTKGKHPFERGIRRGLPPTRAAITRTMMAATTQALR